MSHWWITSRLAVGDLASRTGEWDGIVSAITTTARPGILWVEMPAVLYRVRPGVQVHEVDIADGESWAMGADMHRLESYLDAATEFIASILAAQGKVLVHCYAGTSRSVAVVVAYLCRYAGMDFKEAYAFVRAKHPEANISTPFVLALRNWLREE